MAVAIQQSKDNTKVSAKILRCSCPHEFQDKEYGKGSRVHNPIKGPSAVRFRCTVCGKERD